MRKLCISLALASTAIATPAVARDHSFYAGVEGGIMWLEDVKFNILQPGGTRLSPGATVMHKRGLDVDGIAGYDFGMLRVEGELGYKRASVNQMELDSRLSGGGPLDNFDANGRSRALSGMLNLLLDYGNDDALSGYGGAGVGIADVKLDPSAVTPRGTIGFSGSQTKLAWQAIAGVRYAITPNIDLGLKYRFFNVPHLRFYGATGATTVSETAKWRSHSVLASLVYNFYAPPPPPLPAPPPPPPPPAPATQTCPDGSVILATSTCPVPPPPPPPPPPAPERGL